MPEQPPGANTGSLYPVTHPYRKKHFSQGLCRQGQGRIWAAKGVPAGTATPRFCKAWQLPRSNSRVLLSSTAATLFHTERINCTAPTEHPGLSTCCCSEGTPAPFLQLLLQPRPGNEQHVHDTRFILCRRPN